MYVAVRLSDLVMLVESFTKLSLVPNKEMQPKLLSYRDGSAGWFTLYGMTVGALIGATCSE